MGGVEEAACLWFHFLLFGLVCQSHDHHLIIIIVIVILLIAIPYIPPPRVRHPGITGVGRVRWFPCRPHHRLESFMTYGSFMFSMLIHSSSNSQHTCLAMQ